MRDLVRQFRPSIVKVRTSRGLVGSGFFVSEDGHVVTNQHVIETGDIQVYFKDDWKDADLISRNREYDYAVLKIPERETPKVRIGRYSDMEEGDPLMFLGFPFDFETVSVGTGCVSAKFLDGGINYLQIDGSVNKGNSGGPLISRSYQNVVGVITRRCGDIDNNLRRAREMIGNSRGTITARIAGIDIPGALGSIINVLDTFTNVGIGFAVSIDYVARWLRENGII